MLPRNEKHRQSSRFILLAFLSLLCMGMIFHSARAVRYPVGDAKLSEFTVTELSLSHSIERAENGSLKSPDYEPEHTTDSINETVKSQHPKQVVTPPKIETKELVSAKPAQKKITSKKTAPKKSAPKKPVAKAPAKKAPVKKTEPKKAAPKKPAEKESGPKKPAKKPCPT